MKQEDIIAIYQQIIEQSTKRLQEVEKRIRLISFLRLLLFVSAVAGAIVFWSEEWWKLILFSVVPFLAFVWLIKVHNKWFNQRDYLKKKIEINNQELKAFDYDFSLFDGGEEYINATHDYTFDLDIFGEHSLFQYINRTSTPIGKKCLAKWINAHLEKKEAIELRQEGVEELTTDLKFRQKFRLLGLLFKGKASDTTEVVDWANSPSIYRNRLFLRLLPTIVSVINLISICLCIAGIISASLSGGIFVFFVVFSFVFSKGITKIQATYGKKLQILSTYADQILLVEQKEVHSHVLREIKKDLMNEGHSASQVVHNLAKLMNALDQRNNLLISTILNGLIFWELRQVMKIEKWKDNYAKDLPRWIEAVGEMDAYCSLATFAYNHPDYIFPKIASRPFVLKGTSLGHPLMNRNKCVRNGIDIEKRPFFMIVTGANMAGKSTYLRTVGVNYLLACIGAPVWADSMEIYPSKLITSLRTSDSLSDNESYFFAELKRLKLIIDKLIAGEELFIILDEILKGTNSVDKQKGSFALIKQFVTMNTNGIIATHDLLLGTLVDLFPNNIKNYCFEADITNNELTFSYKIREGLAQNMNACFLMKKMGIAVVDEDDELAKKEEVVAKKRDNN